MKTTFLKFENRQGIELSAKLLNPVTERPKAYAIFAHCFTCNKNFKAINNIALRLTQEDIAVLSFDFTGLG